MDNGGHRPVAKKTRGGEDPQAFYPDEFVIQQNEPNSCISASGSALMQASVMRTCGLSAVKQTDVMFVSFSLLLIAVALRFQQHFTHTIYRVLWKNCTKLNAQ